MSAAAARGPLAFLLQSQTGQWVTISLGAMYAFPEQAKMVLGDLGSYAALARQMSGFTVPTLDDKAVAKAVHQPQSIIIHQTLPSDGKNQVVTLLIKVVIGGSACWLGYFALTNALPEYMQEFFPVTRKFFSRTSKFLVSSIEQVKTVLEEQIGVVSRKQDDLSKKLDGTHDSVEGLHKKLGDTRGDLDKLGASMARQESTLTNSYKTTSYTSKGVTLLVRCVASLLPSNDRTVHDLAEYIQDGEEIRKHELKQEQQRRIANAALKAPVSMMSPSGLLGGKASQPKPQILIRESRADSDMDSLEDVHAVLGITPQSAIMT
eukprot:CAMPEP_0197178480 /NCGR_PEP_ID=MMETSP1423-20130617/3745_1 /TAXON_ID=476441 /ORGANISM="Pseudo-nitzschia heimii, Strain UNC1101" /LENGTH=319 /DNA_ID=CAMNT_0042628229 /DNA_START=373 /DNA_END=1332 /DNA_ORIENTATION=+